jgi:hypothetical protein
LHGKSNLDGLLIGFYAAPQTWWDYVLLSGQSENGHGEQSGDDDEPGLNGKPPNETKIGTLLGDQAPNIY